MQYSTVDVGINLDASPYVRMIQAPVRN